MPLTKVQSQLLGTGTVLQVYTANATPNLTTTSQMSINGTTPSVSQGVEVFSASFTPTSATSKILIDCVIGNIRPTGVSNIIIALFEGSTCLAANTPRSTTNEPEVTLVLKHSVVAGSISARTYSIRVAPQNAVTLYLNNANSVAYYSVPPCSLSIMEIAG